MTDDAPAPAPAPAPASLDGSAASRRAAAWTAARVARAAKAAAAATPAARGQGQAQGQAQGQGEQEQAWVGWVWVWRALGVLAALLALLHARRYLRPPPPSDGVQILQAPAAAVTEALLAERRPLVVDERAVDPTQLVGTAFRWQHVSANLHAPSAVPGEPPRVADARFTLLFFPVGADAGAGADAAVLLQPPAAWPAADGGDGELLVRLGVGGRTLVLPPQWRYSAVGAVARVVKLHDPVSLLLRGIVHQKFSR